MISFVYLVKKLRMSVWKEVEASRKAGTSAKADSLFAGIYRDNWLGEVTLSIKNGKLWFDAKRSPNLTGEMLSYKGNTFIVKWNDRSMDADAYVMFTLDQAGKPSGMRMKAVSPMTDFSYDFQDLDFTRTGN